MTRSQSNREIPEYVAYFKTLADILGIFWQFHKARLAEGKTAFSYISLKENIPFDPQQLIDRAKGYRSFQGKDIVKEYALGTFLSLDASWQLFLQELKNCPDIPSTVGSERFIDPYVVTLCEQADMLGEVVGQYNNERRMKQVVTRAIGTGTKVTTHLVALFGDEFTPILPVIISKVKEDKIAEREIGIDQPWVEGAGSDGVSVSYKLLDAETGKFNMKRLQQLGYRSTLGCPGSMPVSRQTRSFLLSKGITVSRTMMKIIRKWFKKNLTEQLESGITISQVKSVYPMLLGMHAPY